MFRLADTMTNRHVVQVFDKEGKQLYATVLAIPDRRLAPSGKNIVLFAERPSGSPQAIKSVVVSGRHDGRRIRLPDVAGGAHRA